MKRKTLTAAGVARVRAPDDPRRRRMDWDAVVPGLALRTTAHGSKSWVLVTRFAGRVRFVTVGKAPGLALPKARELAREGLERVANGEDPQVARRTISAVDPLTIEPVAALFIEKWAKPRNRTWAETERQLTKYVFPHWKGRRLDTITRADVIALADAIGETNGPIMANRVQATISKLFGWALKRDLIAAHPAVGLEKHAPERKRDRVLTVAELRALWKAWEAMAYPWGVALKVLLLTAARRGEVEGMTWDELDLEAGLWTIPAERVKVKLPMVIPLAPPAVALLSQVPRFDGCPFVFSTRGKRPAQDWSGAVTRTTEAAGVTGWRVHDLRRTARTNLSALGVSSDIAERVLGHVLPGVRAVYDRHDYLNEKRDALERWGAHLTKVIAGGRHESAD